MLPPLLLGSYRAYKKDTDAVAQWLSTTAVKCGYSPDPATTAAQPPAPRLKGRARKLARDAAKDASKPGKSRATGTESEIGHIIAVKDFLILADRIASWQQPPITIPRSCVKALDRAIDLRHKHNAWYQTNASQRDEIFGDDGGHEHFATILERTREILKPCLGVSAIQRVGGTCHEDRTHQSPRSDRTNAFASLDVEEPSENTTTSPAAHCSRPSTPTSTSSQTEGTKTGGALYETEQSQRRDEQYFAAHCLFTDVAKVRRFLKELWLRYRHGHIDLIAVAITNNTAMDLVRRMENDFDSSFPQHPPIDHMGNVLFDLFDAQSTTQSASPSDDAKHELADYAALLTRLHLLNKLFRSSELSAVVNDVLSDEISLLAEFILLIRPLCRDNHRSTPPAEDELLRAVQHCVENTTISLWAAFAVQAHLDIKRVLGPIALTRGQYQLQQQAVHVADWLQGVHTLRSDDKIEAAFRRDFGTYLQFITSQSEFWVGHDGAKIMLELADPRVGELLLHQDSTSLLAQHPALCGTWMFYFYCRMQDAGLAFARSGQEIMACAHLYNALRQEKLLNAVWPDMELLINLHGEDRLFIGGRPTRVGDYCTNFAMMRGMSAAAFAKSQHSSTQPPRALRSAKGPRHLRHPPTLAGFFVSRYVENAPSVMPKMESIGKYLKRTSESYRLEADPVSFLSALSAGLHAEGPSLMFDYIQMRQICYRLLKAIESIVEVPLYEAYKWLPIDSVGLTTLTVPRVFTAMFTADHGTGHLLTVKHQVIAAVSSCFMEVLGSEQGSAVSASMEKRYNCDPDCETILEDTQWLRDGHDMAKA